MTKSKPITLRLPEDLLRTIINQSHVDSIEQGRNIGYTDLIRSTLISSFADPCDRKVGPPPPDDDGQDGGE